MYIYIYAYVHDTHTCMYVNTCKYAYIRICIYT